MKKQMNFCIALLVAFVSLLGGCGKQSHEPAKTSQTASVYINERLVRDNEEIIYSVVLDEPKRYATLCMDQRGEYIAFRIGTAENLVAEIVDPTWTQFRYSTYRRGGLDPYREAFVHIDDENLTYGLGTACEVTIFAEEERMEEKWIYSLTVENKKTRAVVEGFNDTIDSSVVGNLIYTLYDVMSSSGYGTLTPELIESGRKYSGS